MLFFTGHIGKKYLNNLNRIRKNTIKRRCLFVNTAKKNKKKSSSAPDKDYGLAEPLIDTILPEELEIKKNCFLNKLKTVNLHQLNLDTRDQSGNQKWFQERKKRLTASKFGDICKMRQNTSCKRQVHAIIYKPQIKTKELTHGIEMESYGRKKFEDVSGLSVETCGLIVDSEIPFLAASPGKIIFVYNIYIALLAYNMFIHYIYTYILNVKIIYLLLYYYIFNFQMVWSVMILFLKSSVHILQRILTM